MRDDPAGHCLHEVNSYHLHLYDVHAEQPGEPPRPAIIEHHLHTWMDEHRQIHPDAKEVYAYRRLGRDFDLLGKWDTLDQAWTELGVAGEVPRISCTSERT
ncbi:hypothetical protein [Nonomuraea sp. NPDC023979]|uniref:hypothetical protein n=1 Tax=Nonomuraea sp. NPDC023979 TaxID=3154796 RepID=UPI00340EE35F